MAVVGEAHILVRAVTTQVKKDIQNGLKGVRGQGTDSGQEFGKGFSSGLAQEMMQAQKSFSSLMRRGYVLQAGLGALVGTVGSLVGGIAALGGAALAAGASFTVLANGMVALKVATSVGGMALRGVSQAVSAAGSAAGGAGNSVEELQTKMRELRLEARRASIGQKQAALDYEKAKMAFERTADLPEGDIRRRQAAIDLEEARLSLDQAKEDNANAKKELQAGPQAAGGADPYAGLTKTQKEFAQYLVSIQSKMERLREAAASSFLPELQKQLQNFIARGFMGTLVESFTYLSEGLAKITADFSRSFISTKNMRLLAENFRNVTTTLGGFGAVMGKTFEGFLYYLKNTNPLLDRFVAFLQRKTSQFASDQQNNASAIQAFFRLAGDTAADFGTIFGNVFERIKRFIGNVIGPGSGGQLLLDWLKEVSGNFRNFDRDVENAISRKYFKDAAVNTKTILETFSGLFTFLVRLGGNPAVGQFWKNLQNGNGALAQIVTNGVEAAPALANVLVSITKILAALSDSAQVLAFFDTLNVIFTSIATMLKDMKPLLDAFGPLIGTLSAIGLVFLGFKSAVKIVGGFVLLALKPLVATLLLVNPAALKAGTGVTLFGAATTTTLKAISAAIVSVPVVGWLLGIVSAVAAAGTALSMWSANTAEQTAQATRNVAKSGADIQKIWSTAQEGQWAITEGDARFGNTVIGNFFYEWSAGAEGTREKLDNLAIAQKNWLNAALVTGPATTEAAGQFERLGMGISEIFSQGGLPAASAAMKQWTKSQELNSEQSLTAYKEMDSLREQVRAYAQDLGVDLVDAQAEYNFLLQDTSYQTAIAKIKQDALNQSITNAISGFIDLNKPLQQNDRQVEAWAKATEKYNNLAKGSWKSLMDDYEKTGFSIDYYLTSVRNQVTAATDYAASLGKAQAKLSDAAFQALVARGKDGADLATYIANAALSPAEKKKIEDSLLLDTGNMQAQIAASFDPTAVAAAIRAKYGNQGFSETIIKQMFDENISTQDAMKQLGIDVTNLVATAAKENPTELTAKWGAGVADNLRKELVTGLNGNPITLTAKKDGGPITGGGSADFPGAKNGGLIKRFFSGGTVTGVGGPRADNIPAMLSVGEFVVNAAAARRNADLLTAINSGNASDLMADAIGASKGTTTNIGITVNAAPGMNTDEIVSEVERRLAFQLRRGVNV
jgi:hypothetical protein